MKANLQLVANMLAELVAAFRAEPELARAVLATIGIDVNAVPVQIDQATFKKLADKAVAEALDKRELRTGEIATIGAQKLLDGSAAKFEAICKLVLDSHLKPTIDKSIADATATLNAVNAQIAKGDKTLADLTRAIIEKTNEAVAAFGSVQAQSNEILSQHAALINSLKPAQTVPTTPA
jgi:hypothetical protein